LRRDGDQSFPKETRPSQKAAFFRLFVAFEKREKMRKQCGKDAKKGGKYAPGISFFKRLWRVRAKKNCALPLTGEGSAGFRLRRLDLGWRRHGPGLSACRVFREKRNYSAGFLKRQWVVASVAPQFGLRVSTLC